MWARRKLEILDEDVNSMMYCHWHAKRTFIFFCTYASGSVLSANEAVRGKLDTCSADVGGGYLYRSCHFFFDGSLELTVVVIPGDVTYDASRWLVRDWLGTGWSD